MLPERQELRRGGVAICVRSSTGWLQVSLHRLLHRERAPLFRDRHDVLFQLRVHGVSIDCAFCVKRVGFTELIKIPINPERTKLRR
jgi:hypothetical protein